MTYRKQLIIRTQAAIRKWRMFDSGDSVLTAVSGGPDSMALLRVLHQLKDVMSLNVHVAHVNHCLRSEAQADADFVIEEAERLGLPVYVRSVDVGALACQTGTSLEEAGRNVRYAFFKELCREKNIDKIATAHHKDDLAETVFLRMMRGSSLDGLSGIPPVRGPIVRPFISIERHLILKFLAEENIPYKVDDSNYDDQPDRNFMRNRIIPLVKNRFPAFSNTLFDTAEILRSDADYLEKAAAGIFADFCTVAETAAVIKIELRRVHEALSSRVLLRTLHGLGNTGIKWSHRHVQSILGLMSAESASGLLNLPGGLLCRRDYDRIIIERSASRDAPEKFLIEVEGPACIWIGLDQMLLIEITDKSKVDLSSPQDSAYFDADLLNLPIHVRNRLPGDRMRPWGLNGTRKLKKILIDAKYPVTLRDRLPLVCQADAILWVPGIVRSDLFPVTERTVAVLKMSINETLKCPSGDFNDRTNSRPTIHWSNSRIFKDNL